jgi:hypothetical protein
VVLSHLQVLLLLLLRRLAWRSSNLKLHCCSNRKDNLSTFQQMHQQQRELHQAA